MGLTVDCGGMGMYTIHVGICIHIHYGMCVCVFMQVCVYTDTHAACVCVCFHAGMGKHTYPTAWEEV